MDAILKEESKVQLYEEHAGHLAWLPLADFPRLVSFQRCKAFSKYILSNKCEDALGKKPTLFLIPADNIIGKPMPLNESRKKFPLMRKMVKEMKKTDLEKVLQKLKKNPLINQALTLLTDMKELAKIVSFTTFDEKIDLRKEGYLDDKLIAEFFQYRIIHDKRDYIVLSVEELPLTKVILRGMIVPLDDLTALHKELKLKSELDLFIVHSHEPAVKILSKEQIIELTQNKIITSDFWLKFLTFNNDYNSHLTLPPEMGAVLSAFMLGGKKDNYPLHLWILGLQGSLKSSILEAISYKFSEEPAILEGGNSTLKSIEPSFKEKPCNIGHLARADRIAPVDEIGKLLEKEQRRHEGNIFNLLGSINFLLDHKKRTVGSGNDNSVALQCTAQSFFVSNPVKNKSTLAAHAGLIDRSTMSRFLFYVQNDDEIKLLREGIVHDDFDCWEKWSRDDFLSLFDTCKTFLSSMDKERIKTIFDSVTEVCPVEFKEIWQARGLHHTTLVIDGLIKHRCLFKDYDSSFTATEDDYILTEQVLFHVANNWAHIINPDAEDHSVVSKPFNNYSEERVQ